MDLLKRPTFEVSSDSSSDEENSKKEIKPIKDNLNFKRFI